MNWSGGTLHLNAERPEDATIRPQNDSGRRPCRYYPQCVCTGRRYRRRAFLRPRSLQRLSRGGGRTAAYTEAYFYRTEFPQHRQQTRHDRDRSARVPYDVTPENAEPNRHARTDGGCDRLYPQLPLHTVILRTKRPAAGCDAPDWACPVSRAIISACVAAFAYRRRQ